MAKYAFEHMHISTHSFAHGHLDHFYLKATVKNTLNRTQISDSLTLDYYYGFNTDCSPKVQVLKA